MASLSVLAIKLEFLDPNFHLKPQEIIEPLSVVSLKHRDGILEIRPKNLLKHPIEFEEEIHTSS